MLPLLLQHGWSATMERIQRAQALGDSERAKYMRGSRTLEINPTHPLVKELKSRVSKRRQRRGSV